MRKENEKYKKVFEYKLFSCLNDQILLNFISYFQQVLFVKKIKVFKDDKTGDKWRIKRRGMRKRFDKIYCDRIILYANESKKK